MSISKYSFANKKERRRDCHGKDSRGPSDNCVFLKFQWRPSWILRKKSLVESTKQAVGTGHGAMLQTNASPGANCFLSLPSNDAHAGLLLLNGICTLKVTCSGNINGLKDSECGQIGVNKMPGTCRFQDWVSNEEVYDQRYHRVARRKKNEKHIM
jgi:hypothetical protein